MINTTAVDTTDEIADVLDTKELEDIKKRSVNGVISYFIRTAFLQAIGLTAAFVLSAFLNEKDFGIYGFVLQIIGLLTFFSDIGLAASLIQKKTEPTLADYRTAFTVQQLLSLTIVGVCLAVIATGFVEKTVGSAGIWLLLSLAISFPLASFKTISAIKLERNLEFSKLVLPQIVETLVFYSILVVLAWRGWGVSAYTVAIIVRSIIGTIVMFAIKPWAIGISFNQKSFKDLTSFGFKFQANDFLARIKDNLLFIFIGRWLPINQFGFISWSKQWSMYPYSLTVQNVTAITFPTFSRLQGHTDALTKAINKTMFFITLSIFPLLVGMCVFIVPLVRIIPSYAKWEPALFSFIMFTLSIGWAALSTPLTNTLNAIGKIDVTLKLMLFWTVLAWVATPLALWKWGFNGVAAVNFLISFTSIIPIYLVKKLLPIDVWDNVWRQLLAATLMAGVGILGMSVWQRGLPQVLLGMGITSLVYVGTIGIFGKDKMLAELASLRKR